MGACLVLLRVEMTPRYIMPNTASTQTLQFRQAYDRDVDVLVGFNQAMAKVSC